MSSWWEDIGEAVKQAGGGIYSALGAVGDFILWPVMEADQRAWGDQHSFSKDMVSRIEQRRANPGIDTWGYTPGDAIMGTVKIPTSMVGIPNTATESAVATAGKWLAKPADVTSDVIASAALVISGQAGWGSDAWDRAWAATGNFDLDAPDQVSPGQAIAAAFSGKSMLKPADVAELRNDAFFNFASGLMDLANTVFLDPLVVGGKVGKGLRMATVTRPLTPSSRLGLIGQRLAGSGFDTKGLASYREGGKVKITHLDPSKPIDEYLASSSWNKLWEWKQNKTVDEIAETIPDNEYRSEIAAALSLAKNRHEFDLVGRLALGDEKARADLYKRNERLALGIDNVLSQKRALISGPLSPDFKTRMALIDKQLELMRDLSNWYDRLLELPRNMQYQTPGGFRAFGRDFLTSQRYNAASRRAKRNLKTQESVFVWASYKSKNPLEPVVRVARRSRTGTLPTGWVNLNRPDGHMEIRNTLNLTPLGEVEKSALIQQYQMAYTPQQRMVAAQRAESEAIKAIAAAEGYRPNEIGGVIREYFRQKGKAVQDFQERAYSAAQMGKTTVDVFEIDGIPYRLPIHPSQTMDIFHMPDVVSIRKILRQSHTKRAVRAAYNKGVDLAEIAGDAMSGLWKTSVLLRLGYPIRVLTDDQARLLVTLGGIGYSQMIKELGKNFWLNSFSRKRPKVDWGDGKLRRQALGQGTLPYLDGKVSDAWDSLSRPNTYYDESGSGDTWIRDLQVQGRQLNKEVKASGNWVEVEPGAEQHIDVWYKSIMNQQMNNPIVKKLVAGEDPDDIVSWLQGSSKEAVSLRKQVPHFAADPEDWVTRIIYDLENTMPNPAIRDLARDGKLTKADLEAIPVTDRPRVNGPQIDYNLGSGEWNRVYKSVMERIFKFLGQMPTDGLSRHPYFVMLYRDRVERLAYNLSRAYPDVDSIPQLFIDQIEKEAREYALKNVKETLYDISARSNISHTLRFISPFFSAWQDSMTTWLGLVKRDPSIFPRTVSIWNAPNQVDMYQRDEGGNIVYDEYGQPQMRRLWGWAFEVTDKDGNPITDKHNIWFTDPTQQVRIHVPEWLGNSITGGMTVDISKSSIFSIAQGETPWLPGGGPFINIAASEVLKHKPEWEDALKWILPYGAPPSYWDNIIPASFKNFARIWGDTEDKVFAQTQFMIMQSEMVKYFEGQRKSKPTWDEITDRSRRYYALKAFSSFTLPFSPAYKSPHQWFIDTYHKYQREAAKLNSAVSPDQMFYDRFGDSYYILSKSLDKNMTGIPASKEALALTRKYADQIAQDPEMGRLIIGPVGDADFSTSVYRWQFDNEAIPGSGIHFRERQTPYQAFKDAQVSLGWMKYRSVVNGLMALLTAQGFQGFDDPGAEQIKEVKSLLTAALGEQNPDWRDAFTLHDDDKMIRRIETFERWVKEPKLIKDPQRQDIQGLSDYLDYRRLFVQELASRGQVDEITGRLKKTTLDAEKNADLKEAWANFKSYMASQNTKFSDLFYTYLEFDNLQY